MALAIGALVRRLLAVTEQAEDIEWLRREVEAVSRDMLALIGAPEMSRPTGSSSQMEYRATSPRRGEYDRQR
jgi:hypothetical protein